MWDHKVRAKSNWISAVRNTVARHGVFRAVEDRAVSQTTSGSSSEVPVRESASVATGFSQIFLKKVEEVSMPCKEEATEVNL